MSLVKRTPVLSPIKNESDSNLFLIEFMLRWPVIVLSEWLTRKFPESVVSFWCSKKTSLHFQNRFFADFLQYTIFDFYYARYSVFIHEMKVLSLANHEIGNRTLNHLIRKLTLNHIATYNPLGWLLVYKFIGSTYFESRMSNYQSKFDKFFC